MGAGTQTGGMSNQCGADESGPTGYQETVIRQCRRPPGIVHGFGRIILPNSDAGAWARAKYSRPTHPAPVRLLVVGARDRIRKLWIRSTRKADTQRLLTTKDPLRAFRKCTPF